MKREAWNKGLKIGKITEETRRKRSESLKGKQAWNKDLKTGSRSEDTKRKLSESHKKKWINDEIDIEERTRKWKKSVENKKVGRPSTKDGGSYERKGSYKKCKVCDNSVYYTPKELTLEKIKCCSRKCLSQDSEYIQKLKNIDKSYTKTEEFKNKQRNPEIVGYKRYCLEVRGLTEENYKKYSDIINPDNLTRSRCGVENGYQLDHIKSIKECWNQNLSVEFAASVENLEMISWQQNLKKRNFQPPKEK